MTRRPQESEPSSQSADTAVAFEVASIKASPPPDGRGIRVGCPSTPGRITCTSLNMANLVTMAYGIASYQLSGIERSNTDWYDVAVKIPQGAMKEQIKLMWQNLLKERFKLAVHHETKDAQVYELVVAKGGLKIQESVEKPVAPADGPPDGPRKPSRSRCNRLPLCWPGKWDGL